MIVRRIKSLRSRWLRQEDATAAVESALVFPILLTLLLGTFDMGNAILSNQKVIRASQVAGDLVTRERTVDTAALDEAIEGGELALEPLDSTTFGIDIVSISFDDDGESAIVWRETRGNMSPVADVLDRVEALAAPNEGVVVITVRYTFEPIFSGFVIGDIPMEETAFTRA